jgi:hypothetical protein
LNGNALVVALREEDRLLRRLVARLPRAARELHGTDGTLSCKETLGHIAFWDDFTVDFFQHKLDIDACALPPPVEIEERSREALSRIRCLPFGEVLARYLESTGALIAFLDARWSSLSERERHDFWVTLKHRRHHRLCLAQALRLEDGNAAEVARDSLAAGA